MIQQLPDTCRPIAAPSFSHGALGKNSAIHENDHTVLVLDDDSKSRAGLEQLLGSHGYMVRAHSQAEEILQAELPTVPGCLLLDYHLGGGMNGLQVHQELQKRGCNLRTVFLASEWNVKTVVAAMRAGADNFLTKPYNPAELLESLAQALQRARAMHQAETLAESHRARAATLTDRERQIIRLVVDGRLNKEIADQLGLALITVKVHRGRAMKKLCVGNPAELACVTRLAGL